MMHDEWWMMMKDEDSGGGGGGADDDDKDDDEDDEGGIKVPPKARTWICSEHVKQQAAEPTLTTTRILPQVKRMGRPAPGEECGKVKLGCLQH